MCLEHSVKLHVASREIFVCYGKQQSLSPNETRCCAADGWLERGTPELLAATAEDEEPAAWRQPPSFRSSVLQSRARLVVLTPLSDHSISLSVPNCRVISDQESSRERLDSRFISHGQEQTPERRSLALAGAGVGKIPAASPEWGTCPCLCCASPETGEGLGGVIGAGRGCAWGKERWSVGVSWDAEVNDRFFSPPGVQGLGHHHEQGFSPGAASV